MRKTIAVLSLLPATALSAETVEEFDRRIEQDLRAIRPDAIDLWRSANEARAAGKHEEAAQLYAVVFEQTPTFIHALRRQANEELALGKTNDAKKHMRY